MSCSQFTRRAFFSLATRKAITEVSGGSVFAISTSLRSTRERARDHIEP
jgi:hypothetical protein